MLDQRSMDEFGFSFAARMENNDPEACACQVFPEVSHNDHAVELVHELLANVREAFAIGGPERAHEVIGHALTVAIAFGMGYGALDAITDDSGDYSWGLSDDDIAALSREDFLGD